MSGIATAADLGSLKDAPEYTYSPAALWTGWYIGGHIGGANTKSDLTDHFDYYGDPIKKTSLDSHSLIGGIHLGYNRQSGHLVYGVEADIGKLDISKSSNTHLQDYNWNSGQHSLDANYSLSGGLYGDITGRVGYSTSRSLFYIKGGAAFLNADVKANYVGGNCSTHASDYWWDNHCREGSNASKFGFSGSDTMWGWTIGAGVEYALSSKLSLKAEYQHFDFGSTSINHDGTYQFSSTYHSTLTGSDKVDITADAVTVGLNYNLSGNNGGLK